MSYHVIFLLFLALFSLFMLYFYMILIPNTRRVESQYPRGNLHVEARKSNFIFMASCSQETLLNLLLFYHLTRLPDATLKCLNNDGK